MIKVMQTSNTLEMGAIVGIEPQSDGLARAKEMGIAATHEGLEGLTRMPEWKDIELVLDATSAGAHQYNAALCEIDFNGFFEVSLLLKSNSYIKLRKFRPSANPARLSQNVLTS